MTTMRSEYDFLFEIAIVGDSDDRARLLQTIRTVSTERPKIVLRDGTTVKLNIRDINHLHQANPYRGVDAVVFVYDRTNKGSSETISERKEEVDILSSQYDQNLYQYECSHTLADPLPLLQQIATQLVEQKRLTEEQKRIEEFAKVEYERLMKTLWNQVAIFKEADAEVESRRYGGKAKEREALSMHALFIRAAELKEDRLKSPSEKLKIMVSLLKGHIEALHESQIKTRFLNWTTSSSTSLAHTYKNTLDSLSPATKEWAKNIKADKVSLSPEKPVVKKVLLQKTALFQFVKKDREGNDIPTQAMRTKIGEQITIDTTNGQFDRFLQEDPKRKIYTNQFQRNGITYTEERITTPEENEMIVYGGIIFYKSSATSVSEFGETKRLNTWVPSLGLDDASSSGPSRSKKPTFKITKLESLYDEKFSKPDERIKKYEKYLGNDLMLRFNKLDIMLMSAEIGGGFWDTKDGKNLVSQLKKDGYPVDKGIVHISDKSEHQFEIPFEIKKDDDNFISEKTREFNNFFKEQGGCLHDGVRMKEVKQVEPMRDVHQEISQRAADHAIKNKQGPGFSLRH